MPHPTDDAGSSPASAAASPDSAAPSRRIALLVESSRAFGRGVLEGLAQCLQPRHDWIVYYQEGGLGELMPGWFPAWQGDGIIARIEDGHMARALSRKRVPVVDIRGRRRTPGIPIVKTDDVEIARLVAEHLLERGFRRFAFCGFEGAEYSACRSAAFARFVREAGFSCRTFRAFEPRLSAVRKQEQYGWAHERHLLEWLRALPKPVGVMACNDARGHQLLNAARQLDISVPDEVAVVGVDNYELVCCLADPPLSSVEQNTAQIAAEAVRVLKDMMEGRSPPEQPIFIKPCRLITRRSSDALTITDPNLRAAVRCIRAQTSVGIGVDEVARHAGLSRRELERRFMATFGRSPGQEILRLRMSAVRALLTETDLPLYRIAEKTGFIHAEYLNVAFKREIGMTPRSYRMTMGRNRIRRPTG
ncbi:MAG: substrate-binding domain-containing protein [Opitutaceae bacterium]